VRYVPETQPQPKPMYRIFADGKFVVDTAYVSKITQAVEDAVNKQVKKIEMFQRD
jgi:hypothetical protein